ncbi:similar to Saccharomyces cerevisiae YLR003C CMS1 Subunit of U3-containing 90S preribosome processome complex involved in production of 18S rRNA and assembly of small ribosomal subunit [Maudiozyma barnettii]|uniref:Similar to Saccharomyces cerevisiae YLR003C CMS1 Subunit of U3-containing 90S preribosome processome complex involved in production of 18S rRNA and assembly of small ribosomal subunit n=1 Tax=Maudiozyma barnettii TaxID=61262 RepID=A0A8H2VC72_9SACH|nr:Cms1p [Kazachstania barnettii]CAB4252569.1 similar to Saccharomyces cerevisiae YLR003C CMS1 Subunit of U3-containing 90S preribosome processome complex involved in production of 18S rRNA and assembly of small ribosomal subunit [Kazachstania barnettii]CAD1779307.1 similar to Saccharomyces cerevisiae YLR003C CMS1 Subunit of U3-containing 90S preribosome processome complex involved in production of 18S rRNA and assembly of small ribosomal subunit [Kazachstania barnettii]
MSNPDDLDDGLIYDYSSSGEQAEEDDSTVILPQDEPMEKNNNTEKKRTAVDVKDESSMSKRQKKLAKRSKFTEKKKELREYEISKKQNLPKSTPEEISEYFTTLIGAKNPDLSALELEEKYLKKTDFLSTARYTNERTLENFPDFIKQFSKAPKTIVFSLTNLRVADVFRTLNTERQCVKLFAKNKLKDDQKTIDMVFDSKNKKFSNIRYFVCTATRLNKIIESSDAFFQGKDKLDIILDASFLDPKENTLLTADDAIVLASTLRTLLDKKSSVKILLY